MALKVHLEYKGIIFLFFGIGRGCILSILFSKKLGCNKVRYLDKWMKIYYYYLTRYLTILKRVDEQMTNDVKNEIHNTTEKCLICGRGCSQNELKCGRGRAYFEALGAGEISEEKMMQLKEKAREHARRHEELKKMTIEERLMFLLGKCGSMLNSKHCGHNGKGMILKVLAERETITQSEIQNIIEIQSGSLSEILSKMEDQDLIVRAKDESDKRKTNIVITEKGKETVNANKEARQKSSQELFQHLSEDEMEQLENILLKLFRKWKREGKPNEEQ